MRKCPYCPRPFLAGGLTVLAVVVTLALLQMNVFGAGQDPLPDTDRSGVTGPASSLVGLSETDVQSRLGGPSTTSSSGQDGAWYFDSPLGTLRVRFKNGMVSEVNPADFELGVLAAKTPAEREAYRTAYAKTAAKAKADRQRINAKAGQSTTSRAKSSPATPPVAPTPVRKPVATDGSAFEDICENWFFYRDRTLRLSQAGDEEGAAKARKQFEQNDRWLSDYPGRTLPATKSGCR